MGLFDHFPYTNFHELNLDWILRMLKEIDATMNEFVSLNSLKYADPIQWDITRQYEKNTIVIDPLTGTAYLSTQPVPSGVGLSNTDYWSIVFDLSQFVTRNAQNFTNRIEQETTTTATFNSNVGDWLIWGDTLYRALTPITAGDAYTVGSNIEHITMENLYNLIMGMLNAEIQTRSNDDITLQGNIDSEANTRELADTAINNRITSLDPYEKFRNKTICVIGDSISAFTTLPNNWVKYLGDKLQPYNCTIINQAVDGASFAGYADAITGGTFTVEAADYYILFLGTNYDDTWGYTTGIEPLAPALGVVVTAITSAANSGAKFFYVSPIKKFMAVVNTILNPLPVMRNLLEAYFANYGFNVLSGYNIGELSDVTKTTYMMDDIHPSEAFSPILCNYILDGLISERSNITAPARVTRTISNAMGGSGTIFIKYTGLSFELTMTVFNYSPATGTWLDVCTLPTFVDDHQEPNSMYGQANGGTYSYLYRISGGKLQIHFFTAPSGVTFYDVVRFEITQYDNK